MSHYLLLKNIGLSKLETECYESLFNQGTANGEQLAARLGKQPNGIYRQLRQLERTGFVVKVKSIGQPTYFYANTVEEALKRLAKYQRQTLKPLVEAQYEAWPARRPS